MHYYCRTHTHTHTQLERRSSGAGAVLQVKCVCHLRCLTLTIVLIRERNASQCISPSEIIELFMQKNVCTRIFNVVATHLTEIKIKTIEFGFNRLKITIYHFNSACTFELFYKLIVCWNREKKSLKIRKK